MTAITIPSRFHGPPKSGNGGFVSGLLADHFPAAVEVRLFAPPPLDIPLDLTKDSDSLSLFSGDTLVARAHATAFELNVPDPPTLEEAQQAAQNYVGFQHHFFPTCFVCGPGRRPPDGLSIFPGPVPGRELVAAPWTPAEDLAGADGTILNRFIWASLDCPGAFAFGREGDPLVLGTMSAQIIAPLAPGEECLLIGWPRRADGRKLYSGTALFSASSGLVAYAKATWIMLASLDQLN